MFPLVPVDSQTGHIGDWGFPYHGLFTLIPQDAHAQDNGVIAEDRSFLLTNNGVILGYPDWSGLGPGQPTTFAYRKFPNTQNSRKIVVPGHAYTRDPAREDGDLLNGVDYQPFAIANDRFIGGFSNNAFPEGWIYPAPDGTRWNITLTAVLDSPDWTRWTLQAFPYGTLRIPNSFYGITNIPDVQTGGQGSYTVMGEGPSGITDLDQVASSGIIQLDINSTGDKAAFGLGGGGNNGLYENFNPNNLGSVANQRKSVVSADATRTARGPSAIWEVTLSGTPGDNFGAVIALIRDQETCAGTVVMNKWEDDDITQYWSSAYGVDCVADSNPQFIRPNLSGGCPVNQHLGGEVTQTSVSLLSPSTNGPIAATCGWTRILDDDTDVIASATNEYLDFKWWTFTDAGADDPWPIWGPASKEYAVSENVTYNGIVFNCTVAHTSDADKEPGVGALWTAFWEIPYSAVNHDVSDVPVWAEASSYQRHSAVREGAADYWLAKGQFISFDSGAMDPEQTNHDQPNTGDNFAAFWDGPFNVLLNPVWIVDKLILENWIIESTYTDPAIASQATITNARWRCLRSHVSDATNQPGVGVGWAQYWEKAISETGSLTWEPPNVYLTGAKTALDIGSGVQLWEADSDHTATELNKPGAGGSLWTENVSAINCRAAIGQLESALNQTAYHVNDHRTRVESIDFHVTDICAGAFYTDADVLKIVETDVHYTRELSDTVFDYSFVLDEEMKVPTPPDGIGTGSISRGTSTCDETFEYKFRVDGTVKHTVTFSAEATAVGSDVWTEKFDQYPLAWAPTGTRTLTFSVDFVNQVNINESFSFSDTIEGGATSGKMFDDTVLKGDWSQNDFVSGFMFEWIDTPYMDEIKQRLEFGALNRGAFAGAGLMNYPGTSVALDAISNVDQYVNPHPFRTARQIEEGEPYPSLLTLWYGRKLVSPFLYGRKGNIGIALDSQYLRVLRPDDLNWIQYGIYGPDAEISSRVVLDQGSPVNSVFTWLLNKDYGDDISCAYDPINQVIHRNSQYRVVYI